MVKDKIKKGNIYIARNTKDNPNADCQAKKCNVSKSIISEGMTVVTCEGKTYHASCAIKEGIKFDPPRVESKKRVD